MAVTEKSKRSSNRNWTKARLMGIRGIFISTPFTTEEQVLMRSINESVDKLLTDWDKNSHKLGFVVRKRYKVYLKQDQNRVTERIVTNKEIKMFKDDPDWVIEEIEYDKETN